VSTIPQAEIDRIKENYAIRPVVSRWIELDKNGRACCPFHQEKSPSFKVSEDGYYKCFGCGAGGDVISFVQTYKTVSFKEACEIITGHVIEPERASFKNGRIIMLSDRMAEGPDETPKAKPVKKTANKFQALWVAKVENFTDEYADSVALNRGLDGRIFRWLKEQGLIGLHNSKHVAFPVHDEAGNVVRCHVKDHDKDTWYYEPHCSSDKGTQSLVIGEPKEAKTTFALESQWDAFAIMSALHHWESPNDYAYIITRGASSNTDISKHINPDSRLILIPQNDPEDKKDNTGKTPAEKWLDRCKTGIPASVTAYIANTPEGFKDPNDWIARAAPSGGDVKEQFTERIHTPETNQSKKPQLTQAEYEADLLTRLEAVRYDPNKPPPPVEVCLMFLNVPVGARGNLSVIGSKVKTGKTGTVTSTIGVAIRGACQAQGDTLGFQWVGEATGAILHFDTEQSPADHHACVERARKRSGIEEIDRLYSYPIGKFSMRERMDILRLKVKKLAEKGKIDCIVLDGGADFVKDVNSTEIACDVVAELMRISQEFNCCIIVVIHENPGTDSGKTRGHFGSELARKAYANLRIDKDPDTDISTIYGNDNRHGSIPKQHGLCFAWDKQQGMHTTIGIYSKIVGQAKENAKITKEREKWSEIYELATDENGTKCVCPELSPDQAAKIIQDISGTKKPPITDTIKKQMQRAEIHGVLRKSKRGTWTINKTGQTGHVWDNDEMS
jgi:hypothetical protein